MTTEAMTFTMHPRLLWDVISRQAGSIAKSILEGVMNSIDAGATYCAIRISESRFSLEDDGCGMSRDDIVKNFGVFGQPHKQGDAVFGRFRMGRGQLMSFGRNVWRTRNMRITADLRPQMVDGNETGALGFEIEEVSDNVNGCVVDVDLYERRRSNEIADIVSEVTRLCKWASIEVTINGSRVSKDAAKSEWSVTTDSAYIKVAESGHLVVYNLGVEVCRIHASVHGVAGTVVSRKNLMVNFARNDIMASCPVWSDIRKTLANFSRKKARKGTLTGDEKDHLVQSILKGQSYDCQPRILRLFEDVTGSAVTPESFMRSIYRFGEKFSVAPVGTRTAEHAHNARAAYVFSERMLARFDAESAGMLKAKIIKFLEIIGYADQYSIGKLRKLEVVEKNTFNDMFKDSYEPIPTNKLTPSEKVLLNAVSNANESVIDIFYHNPYLRSLGINRRNIFAGEATSALAWTDGSTSIWFDRKALMKMGTGIGGCAQIANTLIHEYCHDNMDAGSHTHDEEFYRKYHEITVRTPLVGMLVDVMLRWIEIGALRSEKGIKGIPKSSFQKTIAQIKSIGFKGINDQPDKSQEEDLATAAE